MASIRSFFMRRLSGEFMKRSNLLADPQKARADFEKRMTLLPVARGVSVYDESVDGVPCEWLVPDGCDDAPVLYLIHGGAFIVGGPTTHRRMASFIARKAGMRAVLPDYRLSPEHRHPAALEDTVRVWRALVRGGLDPSRIAICGDSAGGNLSVATMLALRDAGDALPAAAVLLSPWLDLAAEGESYRTRAEYDPWFRPDQVALVAGQHVDPENFKDPLVSPAYADVSGLPPTLIQVGDHEILLSDSTTLAENMRAAGGTVELHVWPDMWHVFQYFIGYMPESAAAIDDMAAFLKSNVAVREAQHSDERAA